MTYGKRLDQALAQAKKTRRQLATHIGCTPQIIGMVISGAGKAERKLSTDNHTAAADYLRVNPHWLATGEGEMMVTSSALTAPSPTLVVNSSVLNQPVASADTAPPAISNIATSNECAVICAAFGALPDDPILRTRVMAEVMTVISRAQGPPAHKAYPETGAQRAA